MHILIGLFITLIGLILLFVERRNFYFGLIFTFGVTLTILASIYSLADKIAKISPSVGSIVSLFIIAFVVLTFLFSVVYLIFNTFVMNKKEGRSPTALLSMLLGINIFFILPFPIWIDILNGSKVPVVISNTITILCFINFVLTVMFVFYLLYSVFYQFIPYKNKVQYIIVLGSGIRSEEVPPLLKSRLDKAIEYYKRDEAPKIVVSGGQGSDEPISEALAMKKYLISQNIPDEKIILEDKSTTTLENMKFSRKKIEEDLNTTDLKKVHIIFSTNNYHVFRASIYARRAKLSAQGVGAPTAHYFLPSALIREFIALLEMHKISLILFFLLLIFLILS
ncbi:hypothetical protein GWK87_02165 [Staphylococcus schleiferi subsp. coagulans]|uniref:YdcF family protein n=1 Tax=Staphylococcus coagulans TaxID=74706 RepID=UPI0015FE4CCF|nr:YdcF family protein [Staphylococcus coagulans]MBA8759131.1 hypothetical protein [Staphylococcus coagulans]MBA8768090.1 hypothetical protein [Staphylococcus coagulans]